MVGRQNSIGSQEQTAGDSARLAGVSR